MYLISTQNYNKHNRQPLPAARMPDKQSVSIGNNFLHKHLLIISVTKWTYTSARNTWPQCHKQTSSVTTTA